MAILQGESVVQALKEAADGSAGHGKVDLLQLAAEEIKKAGEPYTSVYMYMIEEKKEGGDLVLEAFSGRPTEHTRIASGHGVCGSAVAMAQDQIVGDVTSRSDYISCNALTKSELVVLIRDPDDRIIGQIDIDSDHIHPFSEDEVASVRLIAHSLASCMEAGSDLEKATHHLLGICSLSLSLSIETEFNVSTSLCKSATSTVSSQQ